MKRKLYNLVFVFSVLGGLAQNPSYKEHLKKNVHSFESAKTENELEKVSTAFENLALSEKKEWLPFYYAGLCDALIAFQKPKAEIDVWCNKAESFARRADSLSKNNSEVLVLRSMIAAARITVNQAKRGQKYGMMATKFANEAVKLDHENPRAYFVKAQAILYTPPTFGGGEKKAKPVFEQVLEKDKIFKPESSLHPRWGKKEAEQEIKKLSTN